MIERKIMNINSIGFNINSNGSKFEGIFFSNDFLKELNKMNMILENKLYYLTHERLNEVFILEQNKINHYLSNFNIKFINRNENEKRISISPIKA